MQYRGTPDPGQYPAVIPPTGPLDLYEIDYTVNEQKEHSWRFWFNQPDRKISDVISGGFYNSHSNDDRALEYGMRLNDYLMRACASCPLAENNRHYHRHRINGTGDRSIGVGRQLSHSVPALLSPRVLAYDRTDIQMPVGIHENSLANYNIDAKSKGWRVRAHSDFIQEYTTGGSSSSESPGVMWFPVIWQWYNEFLMDMPSDPAPILKGVE